jgi:hypothetical protein
VPKNRNFVWERRASRGAGRYAMKYGIISKDDVGGVAEFRARGAVGFPEELSGFTFTQLNTQILIYTMAAATAAMQQLPVEQLNELCLAPFEFESTRGYEEAMKAHDLAISRLLAIANDLTKDKDSKDLASQRITFHQERKGYIKQVLDGKVPADSLLILPTLKGATKELQTCIPNTEGKSFISSVSNILRYSS